MRLLLVQYSGDFRAAYERARDTGEETYYGHTYVLETLAGLRSSAASVGLLCCVTDERYEALLPSGVSVLGAAANPQDEFETVKTVLEDFDPTHVVILAPLPKVIEWAIARGARTMCLLADSFDPGLARRVVRLRRTRQLVRLFNDPRVEWVGNHNMPACRSLEQIGVRSEKIIPWDWPHSSSPFHVGPKTSSATPPSLLYVGTVTKPKGAWDLVRAVALLRKRGLSMPSKIVGGGGVPELKELAVQLGVADIVEFMGSVPNREVTTLMREAWAVVVPSRRRYPEALPLTIYEALSTRTPIIASDHPMFRSHLVHGETALIFRQASPSSLAARVLELRSDPVLYDRLSYNAGEAWNALQVPVKWADLIGRWVNESQTNKAWLEGHSLSRQPR
jgi:glycosyltransferase involved in cell wall biosynthesis